MALDSDGGGTDESFLPHVGGIFWSVYILDKSGNFTFSLSEREENIMDCQPSGIGKLHKKHFNS